MSRDDALLCLERHATSKIRRAEDLGAIITMGFRGEALPSIASVSRMSVTTRERESASPAATQVIIHGGKLLEVKEAGAPAGTAVEVRNLFFNLPARRKFLRSDETELAHIQHYITLAALAYPEVAFSFTKDGRVVWQLSAVPAAPEPDHALRALRQRMRGLFGDEQKLLPVDFAVELAAASDPEGEEENVTPAHATDRARSGAQSWFRVWGWIGQPGVSRSSREDQHLFVNRRPVDNRGLNFALLEGYHTALMKGRYPVCCLFIEIDPASVDVNIHPAKREVKFHDERLVRRLAAQAVREALLKFHGPAVASPPVPGSTPAAPPPPVSAASVAPHVAPHAPAPAPTTGPAAGPGSLATREFPSFNPLTATPLGSPMDGSKSHRGQQSPPESVARAPLPEIPPAIRPPAGASAGWPEPMPVSSTRAPAGSEPTPLLNVPLRLVGVIGRLYVVFESDRGLVLMDQHAAHERVLFEQMLNRMESGEVPSQRLLLPATVEVSVRDALFLREQLPALTRLGVGLSEFGERTFLLDGLPPMVKTADARRFVLELVDELQAAGQQVNTQRLGEQTIAKTVCRHAVKANDPLAGAELENLVNDLRHCAMPYTCPHGRPTLIEMSYRELEKKFGRLA